MLLSRPDILKAIAEKRLRFSPEVAESNVDQVSVDLRLGRRFTTFKDAPGYLGSIQLDDSIWTAREIWEHGEADEFVLQPGGFVLAQTLETVCLPNDLAGLVEGRSSYGRLGISVHITAPKIDPGFRGTITLEMVNHGKLPFKLRAGVNRPAQLMLLQISQALEKHDLYGSTSNDVFQHQKEPIPRRKRAPVAAAAIRSKPRP